MDTVADTLSREDYDLYEKAMNPEKTQMELSCLAEAKRKFKSRSDYLEHSDLLDYLLEDTAEMQGFFSWLDGKSFDFEDFYSIFVDYVLLCDRSKEEKKKIMHNLYDLMDFHKHLEASRDFISQNAYYFEDYWNQLQKIISEREKC
ncbi:hypothetical protein [Odoribacter splanchnicus]|uniref:hypothetical protein n=1 Tax=Odoribacter splanchnicus TaxID=28118 RepID=UPI00189B79B7|nr:hypothetical protein [Odoribacter splanchnicus]MDB9209678.1 hypothetical protein [Odoribacter splanchnicus]MDB9225392.1 hypothetical protein [Odoribacter splanchnicus]MDB9237835.1 hypothetical protein [Odoribacter splanchnicus]MDB9241793.1 hypothetical protein [Odoribacter splanchnicus]HJG19170.1 hypothetical protein [Odoribacter splanchnicus]